MIRYYTNDEVQQGTAEWHALRDGLITGTDAFDVLRGKGLEQILYTKKNNNFTGNYYTRRGHALENEAREIYSHVFNKVLEFGFVKNTDYPICGYSPDGIIVDDNGNKIGLWECKAFNKERHMKVYKGSDAHILAQVQFGLMMTKLPWCDLTLYNPDMEDANDAMLIKRIYPSDEIQYNLNKLLAQMIDDIKKKKLDL